MGRVRPLIFALSAASAACAALIGVRDDVSFATDGGADAIAGDATTDVSAADGTAADAGGGDAPASDAQLPDARPCGPGSPVVRCASNCLTMIVAAPNAVASPTLGFPQGIAVDDQFIYWVSQDDDLGHGTAVVQRASKDGGAPVVISAPTHGSIAIAVDERYVYWVDAPVGASAVALVRMPKDAGPCNGCAKPETISTQPAGDLSQSELVALGGDAGVLAIDSTLVWNSASAGGQAAGPYPSMAVLGDKVYWAWSTEPGHATTLQRAALDLASPANVSAPPGGAKLIAANCERVYASVFDPTYGVVALDPVSSTWSSVSLVRPADASLFVYAFAVDERSAYVGYARKGGLQRADLADGGVTTFATGVSVLGIAVDDTAVYFPDHGSDGIPGGAVWRLLK